MENERMKSIWASTIEQIMSEGDSIKFEIDKEFVTITFKSKNGNLGVHKITYTEFLTLLNSNLHIEMILSNLQGMAYNQLLEKEGSDVRLMV